MNSRLTTKFRSLMNKPGLIQVPGVSDALFARIVARNDFQAIYMTGAGTTAVRLGMPDLNLLTMTEMVDNASRIVDACGLPLIADADNGYGGPLNVYRTVRAYEKSGTAAIHLEDQVLPKRCGHMAGKQLVSKGDMVAKIKAAVDARTDPDFTIIARTDAIAVEGFEKAIERADAYREAGADALFVEAPTSMEQLRAIPQRVTAPHLYNMASSGKTPFLNAIEIEELGFRMVIYPNWMLFSAITAAEKTLRHIKQTGTVADLVGQITTFEEFFDLLGMQEMKALDGKYAASDDGRIGY